MGELINPNPVVFEVNKSKSKPIISGDDDYQAFEIYDILRNIKDPEHSYTLEQLKVLTEESIKVSKEPFSQVLLIDIEFTPTVPHCSLASMIGLSIRLKLSECLQIPFKLDIHIAPGKHDFEKDITKQINDKERVCAALENPFLRPVVEELCRYNIE